VGGQDLLELDQGAHGGLLDAGDRGARGGAQADRDRHSLVVVEQQGRHRGPGVQAVAAGRARERVDGVAEVAQALDVATNGPARDLQAAGELLAGPVAARLEQREQLEQSARGGGHGPSASMPAIAASI
jgi:hypothetical protein